MAQKNQDWIKRYQPGRQKCWQGRKGTSISANYHEIIQCIDLREGINADKSLPSYAFVGFACDEGARCGQERKGTDQGPKAFREAFALLSKPTTKKNIYDAGDITCTDQNLEEAQQALSRIVGYLHTEGICPIVIGGGHELTWGHYQGIAKAFPKSDCAIINFDAHFDLLPTLSKDKGDLGISFQQIAASRLSQGVEFHYSCLGIQPIGNADAMFEQAKSLKINIVTADEFHLGGVETSLEIVENSLAKVDNVYFTICLDVLAAAFAPGVSEPQALGIYPWHVIPVLRHLASSGKVIGFDIVGLSPLFDREGTTAQIAAAFAANFIQYASCTGRI